MLTSYGDSIKRENKWENQKKGYEKLERRFGHYDVEENEAREI